MGPRRSDSEAPCDPLSNAPEVYHEPRVLDHGKQVFYCEGLERPFEGLEIPPRENPVLEKLVAEQGLKALVPSCEDLHVRPRHTSHFLKPVSAANDSKVTVSNSARKRRRRLISSALCVLVVLVIVGVVMGGIFGVQKKQSPPTPASSQGPSPPPNVPSDESKGFHTNSSIASATCYNGNRYVFLQDANDTIRVATFASSRWAIAPSSSIAIKAKPGSPIAAGCADTSGCTTPHDKVNSGIIVSVIYLDNSNRLIHAYHTGTYWRINEFNNLNSTEGAIPLAHADSHLDLTSGETPEAVYDQVSDDSVKLACPSLNTVATYQTSDGFNTAVSLFGEITSLFKGGGQTTLKFGRNMLDTFSFSNVTAFSDDATTSGDREIRDFSSPGLTCELNAGVIGLENSGSSAPQANYSMFCIGTEVLATAAYNHTQPSFTNGSIFGTMFSNVYSQIDSSATSLSAAPVTDSDIAPFGISDGTIRWVYQNEDQQLVIAQWNGDISNAPSVLTALDTALPGRHFAASPGGPGVLNYYVVNDTHAAEVAYDFQADQWGQPTLFGFDDV